ALCRRPADRVPHRPRGRRADQGPLARTRRPAVRTLPRRTVAVIEPPVTRLRADAVLPARAYVGDAGLDLAACDRHELGPGERALIGTGLAVAIPAGPAGLVASRSGLA